MHPHLAVYHRSVEQQKQISSSTVKVERRIEVVLAVRPWEAMQAHFHSHSHSHIRSQYSNITAVLGQVSSCLLQMATRHSISHSQHFSHTVAMTDSDTSTALMCMLTAHVHVSNASYLKGTVGIASSSSIPTELQYNCYEKHVLYLHYHDNSTGSYITESAYRECVKLLQTYLRTNTAHVTVIKCKASLYICAAHDEN